MGKDPFLSFFSLHYIQVQSKESCTIEPEGNENKEQESKNLFSAHAKNWPAMPKSKSKNKKKTQQDSS